MLQVPVPAANIEQQVVVNKKLQAYGLHLHFQRSELVTVTVQFYLTMISINRFQLYQCFISFSVLPIAMDRAVKEIVSRIVQRSVSIATQTTKELVLKVYFIPIR